MSKPGLLEHVDEVLEGEVAAGARRERAAAEAADAAVDAAGAGVEGGERVGDAEAAGVVEVHADGAVAGRARRRRGHQRA